MTLSFADCIQNAGHKLPILIPGSSYNPHYYQPIRYIVTLSLVIKVWWRVVARHTSGFFFITKIRSWRKLQVTVYITFVLWSTGEEWNGNWTCYLTYLDSSSRPLSQGCWKSVPELPTTQLLQLLSFVYMPLTELWPPCIVLWSKTQGTLAVLLPYSSTSFSCFSYLNSRPADFALVS